MVCYSYNASLFILHTLDISQMFMFISLSAASEAMAKSVERRLPVEEIGGSIADLVKSKLTEFILVAS